MSLRGFLEEMEKKGEVAHVEEEVSPRFEASSIIKAFDSGPVLYFDEVKGHKTRIVANVCGTRQRICYALEANVENLYRKLIAACRSNFFVTSPLILHQHILVCKPFLLDTILLRFL